MTVIHPDGIYFDLPEEEYHADPAIGSSGIKNLIVSPLKFWIKSAYNPDKIEEEEKANHFNLGDFVHDVLFDKSKSFVTKPKGMSFATTAGKSWKSMVPEGTIILKHEQKQAADLIFMALKETGVSQQFVDGAPEVSFFWTEKSSAGEFRCKIRIDYLKADMEFDAKTFQNSMSKDEETILAHTIANNRYHISAFWYDRGIELLRKSVRSGGSRAVKSGLPGNLPLINRIQDHDKKTPHWYVFMETGGVPNIYVRRFMSHDPDTGELNGYWRAAKNEVERATNAFARCMAEYGPDKPWIQPAYFKSFTDTDFGAARWILEEV